MTAKPTPFANAIAPDVDDASRFPALRADPGRMAAALTRVRDGEAAAVPVLDSDGRAALRAAAEDLDFRPARAAVGTGTRQVTQDFTLCDRAPGGGIWDAVTQAMSAAVNAGAAAMAAPPFEAPPFEAPAFDAPSFEAPAFDSVAFNEVVVQHYHPVPRGISPHRDHLRYINLVVLLIVEGWGDFYVCADRAGHHARAIPADPGDALLMRAPGFDASQHRPFHMLGQVHSERLIVGLRQDTRPGTPD